MCLSASITRPMLTFQAHPIHRITRLSLFKGGSHLKGAKCIAMRRESLKVVVEAGRNWWLEPSPNRGYKFSMAIFKKQYLSSDFVEYRCQTSVWSNESYSNDSSGVKGQTHNSYHIRTVCQYEPTRPGLRPGPRPTSITERPSGVIRPHSYTVGP